MKIVTTPDFAANGKPIFLFRCKTVIYQANTLHEAGILWKKAGCPKLLDVGRVG